MQIDPALHSHADNYKILTNVVVPRPIAWVTSRDEGEVVMFHVADDRSRSDQPPVPGHRDLVLTSRCDR